MADIPEDIMRAAREAVCLHYRQTGLRADAPWLASVREGWCDETPEVSSAALAAKAERQRCEKITRDRAAELRTRQAHGALWREAEAETIGDLISARSSNSGESS